MPKSTRTDLPGPETLRRLHWDEGMTCAQIGQMYSAPGETVRAHMERAGIPRRQQQRPVVDPDEVRRLHHDEGMSMTQIAKALGTSLKTLAVVMDANGIEQLTQQPTNKGKRRPPRNGEPRPLRDWLTPALWDKAVKRATEKWWAGSFVDYSQEAQS